MLISNFLIILQLLSVCVRGLIFFKHKFMANMQYLDVGIKKVMC